MLITGRMISETANLRNIFALSFGAELIYSFVIIVCSLMIYFGTKEVYELSSHKGIKYFRLAFLFFAIAYFFRSFIKFIVVYFDVDFLGTSEAFRFLINSATLFIFIYFSSIAIFYLLHSAIKKDNSRIYLYHVVALVLAFVIVLSRNPLIYLGINVLLFLIVLLIVYISKSTKKKNHLRIIYILLSLFLILNMMDILIPEFFQTFRLFIYMASLGIFLLMLYKVLKKVGSS